MDFEANSVEISQILRKYWLSLGLGALGLIFFVYGLISFLGTTKNSDVIPFSQEQIASNSANLISVDIEGAVINPGVYKLPLGSIIQDALVSSKGLAENADRDFVSKNINLAAKITDGAKIYIPKIGETATAVNVSSQTGLVAQSGLININSASQSQLENLPGIGPVTAEKIINNRPYQSVEDLLNKKVVSSKVYSQIKDKISVY